MASDTFFGGKGSFQEAFPEIATFRADLKRTNHHNSTEESFCLDERNVVADFKCPSRICRGRVQGRGGVHIEGPLRDMIKAKETQRTFRHTCQHPCRAGWDITMDVTYKPAA
jgi:hypothetical protein